MEFLEKGHTLLGYFRVRKFWKAHNYKVFTVLLIVTEIGLYWSKNRLKWSRDSKWPAAHTQQKLTQAPPLQQEVHLKKTPIAFQRPKRDDGTFFVHKIPFIF